MTLLEYYKYASLAAAAYVRAGSIDSLDESYQQKFAEAAQQQGRLPLSIAQYLFDPRFAIAGIPQWTIRHYHGSDAAPDPAGVADASGFAATLFERSTEQGVERVLALRGTELGQDDNVDLWQASLGGIGILGLALPQALSMVNLLLRLRAGAHDTEVGQLKLKTSLTRESARAVALSGTRQRIDAFGELVLERVTVYIDFTVEYNGRGLGAIDSGQKIRVTGHSLGGHLAVLAARLFPDLVDPEVVVFNAPGFDPVSVDVVALAASINPYLKLTAQAVIALAKAAQALLLSGAAERESAGIIAALKTLIGTAASAPAPVVHNLEGEDSLPGDDASLVASIVTGAGALGESTRVGTEINSHSIEQLMDALALQAMRPGNA